MRMSSPEQPNQVTSQCACAVQSPCLALACRVNGVDILQGVARPSGRAGHAVALLRVAGSKDALLVHGGRTKDHKLCRDTWLLELS